MFAQEEATSNHLNARLDQMLEERSMLLHRVKQKESQIAAEKASILNLSYGLLSCVFQLEQGK